MHLFFAARGQAHYNCVFDLRTAPEDFFDVLWVNIQASRRYDYFCLSALEQKISIRVVFSQVSGAQPPA